MTTTSQKSKIEKLAKPTVNIPQSIWSDLFYIHSKYRGLEWSGYLYYDYTGSIKDPDSLNINLIKFILLDIGTPGSTDIQPTGEQTISMFTKNPDIIGKKQGLLHTHQLMGVFFSGTDWDTLLENAKDYDFFLSVIVNTYGNCIAKISLHGMIESEITYKYKFNNGYLEKEPVKKTEEVIYTYDCIINIENNKDFELLSVQKELDKREVLKPKQIGQFYTNTGNVNTHNQLSFLSDDLDKEPSNKKLKEFPKNDFIGKIKKPSENTIKEKVLEFLVRVLQQDEDGLFSGEITYGQALDVWKEEVGEELLTLYITSTSYCIDDIFNDIFGIEDMNKMSEIRSQFQVIMRDSSVENALKPLIMDMLNEIEVDLKEDNIRK